MSKKAFLFPGQGSQYVGMASDLFNNSVEAKEMILTANDALGINLSYIMFNGPSDELKQTEFTQPAIFLHSVVLASIMRTIFPTGAAGHSLGEYSALVASGAIQFYDAIKVVRIRGQAMQQAGIDKPGTMAAIIGMDADEVDELCKEAESEGIVNCANFNSPSQVVISGSADGVRKAMVLCKAGGAKLVKELVVSGAFHSSLMSSAKDKLKTALDETHFYDSKFPVYANVTAKSVTSKDETKNILYQQVTLPVRWEEIINNMITDGYDEFYEIGPGKVLTGLLKRINPDVSCISIDKYADVEKYL